MSVFNRYLKYKKWQDMTIEDCHECGFLTDWDSIPQPIYFDIAAMMNAAAYGIGGNGIDVRCSFADEVCYIWKVNSKKDDMIREFENCGWSLEYENCGEFSTMKKNKDGFEEKVYINYDENDECGFMTMSCYIEGVRVEDFYDKDEEDVMSKDDLAQEGISVINVILNDINTIVNDNDKGDGVKVTDIGKYVGSRMMLLELFGGKRPTEETVVEWLNGFADMPNGDEKFNYLMQKYGIFESKYVFYLLRENGSTVFEIMNDNVPKDYYTTMEYNGKYACAVMIYKNDNVKSVYVEGWSQEELVGRIMDSLK